MYNRLDPHFYCDYDSPPYRTDESDVVFEHQKRLYRIREAIIAVSVMRHWHQNFLDTFIMRSRIEGRNSHWCEMWRRFLRYASVPEYDVRGRPIFKNRSFHRPQMEHYFHWKWSMPIAGFKMKIEFSIPTLLGWRKLCVRKVRGCHAV